MTSQQAEALNRVRAAGLTNLVIGWIGIGFCSLVAVLAVFFTFANYPIHNNDGTTTASWPIALGFGLIIILVFLPFAVVNVISGVKLRKPDPRPYGWLVYSIVAGAVGIVGAFFTGIFTMIPGLIQLVLAILAISTVSHFTQQKT